MNIEEMNGYGGFYFYHLGKTKIIDGYVNIMTNINLTTLEVKVNLIEKKTKEIEFECKNLFSNCENIFHLGKRYHENGKEKLKIIHNMLGIKTYENTRNKRGLINVVGSGLKALFGTMDNEDAEFYDKAFTVMKNNEEFIRNGLKEEIKLIKTLNDQNINMKTNFENLNNKTIAFGEKLNTMIYFINDLNKKEVTLEHLEEIELKIIASCIELEGELDKIIDAILFLKINQIHPMIIAPEKFISILQSSKYENNLIYVPRIDTYNQIVKNINVKCYEKNKNLIVIISIPFVKNETYDTFRVIPIPILDDKKQIIFEKESEYFTISENKEYFSDLNVKEESLIKIENFYIVTDMILESTVTLNNCILNTFMKRGNKICKAKHIPYYLEMYIKLYDNRYLFAISDNTKYSYNCKNKLIEKDLLKGVGMFNVENNCTFSTLDFKITINNNLTEKKNNDVYHPYIDDCCINVKLNDIEYIEPMYKIRSNNMKEIEDISIEINNEKTYLEKTLEKLPLKSDKTIWSILGVFVSIFVIVIFIKIVKGNLNLSIFKNCFNKNSENITRHVVTYKKEQQPTNPIENKHIEIKREKVEEQPSKRFSKYKYDF